MRKSTTERRAPPEKKRKKEPLERSIEDALELGHFIDYRKTWDFVDDLEEASNERDVRDILTFIRTFLIG